jgi:hypothetical protein
VLNAAQRLIAEPGLRGGDRGRAREAGGHPGELDPPLLRLADERLSAALHDRQQHPSFKLPVVDRRARSQRDHLGVLLDAVASTLERHPTSCASSS